MLLTSQKMAQRLEEVDVLHTTRQIDACAQIFPDQESFTVPIGRGVAAITLPTFGRKLNRVTGYGMAGRELVEDFEAIEDLFTKHGVNTEITISPLADPSAFQILASRGYAVDGFLNNYVRVLTDEDLKETKKDSIFISRISAAEAQEFSSCLVAGYRDGGKAESLLETIARIAILRADTRLYIAKVDGKVAGSAGMALIETTKGGVAHFYIDSTLPKYRGRGIQAALLRARLADARKAGFDLASTGARPGSGSCRNIERAGFSLAYSKVWLKKPADKNRAGSDTAAKVEK